MRALAPFFVLALAAVSCVTKPTPDYSDFIAHRPKSILVLPPINNSIEVGASHSYLSVITKPIAERGFYVFPVALVEHYFRSQGITEAAEMHKVPLKKLHEVFGADAIFYVSIEEWGNKFVLVSSVTKVEAEGVLVDAHTGTELWRGKQEAQDSSQSGGGSLGEMLAHAAISQIANEVVDHTRTLARESSYSTIMGYGGFIEGPFVLPPKGGTAASAAVTSKK